MDQKCFERLLSDRYNFKRRWLSDKSGYWMQTRFVTKHFGVNIMYDSHKCNVSIDLESIGINEFGSKSCLPICSKNHKTCEDALKLIRDHISYWKKLSSNDKTSCKRHGSVSKRRT